jgi:hypothetical protein
LQLFSKEHYDLITPKIILYEGRTVHIVYEEQLDENLLKIVMRGGFLSKYTCGMGKTKAAA